MESTGGTVSEPLPEKERERKKETISDDKAPISTCAYDFLSKSYFALFSAVGHVHTQRERITRLNRLANELRRCAFAFARETQ